MTVHSSDQLGDPVSIPVQLPPPIAEAEVGGEVSAPGGAQNLAPDKVVVSNFTRIALLTPPRDQAHLAELQQMVYSGEYGPPAAAIAGALITRALLNGMPI